MKGLAITSKGIEDTAALEIKELIGAICETQESCVSFDFKKFEDLCLLCYKCQSVDRILYLIDCFEFKGFFEEFEKFFDDLKFDDWIKNNKKIKIECTRIGMHDFKSVDVEAKAAEFIIKKVKSKNTKIEMREFDIIFLIYIINNKCYFGIDFAGFELNKRQYKIFLHPNSLRGTIAYALIMESRFSKKDVLLDPFSRDGIIPIEAAFYASNFPVGYYNKEKFAFLKMNLGIDFDKFFSGIDKKIKKARKGIFSYDHLFKYVDYSRKNAKIAGVDKHIKFSRVELEWLDIKFEEGSVDKIISNPPTSRNSNLDKIYNEFFYQSSYILRKNGIIALISRMPDFVKRHAEKHNFVVCKEKDIWSGEQKLNIVIFKKKNI